MSVLNPIPFSVLDLSPICLGSTAADSFRNTLDLARRAESLGFHRFWLAEHHNLRGVASAATAVLIGHVAGGTSRIRVGSGGVMLPNHAPLVIAEQFGTLESLYPGRIDLGLGRAPGTDQRTSAALRRGLGSSGDTFPDDVQELQSYFKASTPGQAVRAVPGEGLNVPIWLLGSSNFSAHLAALLGLPFAFASHFAPDGMEAAIELYRSRFQPSETLARPYLMLAMNVFAAETDAEAQRLFTSLVQQFLALVRGYPGPLPPPVDDIRTLATALEQKAVEQRTRCSAVGSPETVRTRIAEFLERHQPDELMLTAQMFDHAARLHSFEIAASVRDQLFGAAAAEPSHSGAEAPLPRGATDASESNRYRAFESGQRWENNSQELLRGADEN